MVACGDVATLSLNEAAGNGKTEACAASRGTFGAVKFIKQPLFLAKRQAGAVITDCKAKRPCVVRTCEAAKRILCAAWEVGDVRSAQGTVRTTLGMSCMDSG